MASPSAPPPTEFDPSLENLPLPPSYENVSGKVHPQPHNNSTTCTDPTSNATQPVIAKDPNSSCGLVREFRAADGDVIYVRDSVPAENSNDRHYYGIQRNTYFPNQCAQTYVPTSQSRGHQTQDNSQSFTHCQGWLIVLFLILYIGLNILVSFSEIVTGAQEISPIYFYDIDVAPGMHLIVDGCITLPFAILGFCSGFVLPWKNKGYWYCRAGSTSSGTRKVLKIMTALLGFFLLCWSIHGLVLYVQYANHPKPPGCAAFEFYSCPTSWISTQTEFVLAKSILRILFFVLIIVGKCCRYYSDRQQSQSM